VTCVIAFWRAGCLDLDPDDLAPAELDDDVDLVAALLLAKVVVVGTCLSGSSFGAELGGDRVGVPGWRL
jgi:hypothetical protein